MEDSPLREQLFNEILLARQRVYSIRPPTPLERLDIGTSAEVWVKREDQPPIHAYKWRGAYNCMAALSPADRENGVVCASAGNHAQGVALAASQLGCQATIFMPRPTPMMKRQAVALHGGESTEVLLVGDTFDESYQAAVEFARQYDRAFIHPYDDLATMGGQGTLADEVVMSGEGPFDAAFLQIGGGGMTAAVACWLKHYMPKIRIIGVEAEGQASMQAAIANDAPIKLPGLDIFCDGTAVQTAGEKTFRLCRELVDEFMTVTNQEVCNTIRSFWNWRRRIVEPAGALGLAGLLSRRDQLDGKRVLTVTCGANMDFSQLAVIAAETGVGGATRRHFQFRIPERRGALLGLMRDALSDCNIVEFQYGKTDTEMAAPMIGFDSPDDVLRRVKHDCEQAGVEVTEISGSEDTQFRVLRYDPTLFRSPLMIRYDFPERAGALHEFLESIQGLANVCYFSYSYSGERVGRALIGLEFETNTDRAAMERLLESDLDLNGRHQVLALETAQRILGTG
ncbi:MAG: pyridoxal-phosphate dependent enzyme [Planctomycetota bacterium]